MPQNAMDDNRHAQKAEELVRSAKQKVEEDEKRHRQSKPQNVFSGTARGLGCVVGGTMVGAGAILIAPIAGTVAGGMVGARTADSKMGKVAAGTGGAAAGLVGGALGGVVVGVGAVVSGVGKGIKRMGEGVVNTFKSSEEEALCPNVEEVLKEDEVAYQEERRLYMERVFGSNYDWDSYIGNEPKAKDAYQVPINLEFYDTLEVSYDATQSEIKKQYYRLAQATHPDKHPNDPAAVEKFQQIGQAYQVLSDPDKRQLYNEQGRDAVLNQTGTLLEPKLLFKVMFGNDKFKHLIGECIHVIRLTCVHVTPEMIRARQSEREKTLSRLLAARVAPYAESTVGQMAELKKIVRNATTERRLLSEEVFGEDLLNVVGYVYKNKAGIILGRYHHAVGLKGFFKGLEEDGHMFKLVRRAKSSHYNAFLQEQRARMGVETTEEAMTRQTITSLGTVWLESIVDIETTLRKVVQMVCRDAGVTKEVNKLRAQAVADIGAVFLHEPTITLAGGGLVSTSSSATIGDEDKTSSEWK